jgi:hypothetical protein
MVMAGRERDWQNEVELIFQSERCPTLTAA